MKIKQKEYLVKCNGEIKQVFDTLAKASVYFRSLKNVYEVKGSSKVLEIEKRTIITEVLKEETTEKTVLKANELF